MKKRTIIATLALATMCSPAFAYSNVSPKEAPQKVNAINQSLRSVSTFDDFSPFWTINPGKDRYHGLGRSNRAPHNDPRPYGERVTAHTRAKLQAN